MAHAEFSIPSGTRSSFRPGTSIAAVREARDLAHNLARESLKRVEQLAAELADLTLDEEEDPDSDE